MQFAIYSTDGAIADGVQALLTEAAQAGAILAQLQTAPAFAGAAITRSQGLVGSFSVVTPPMPPPGAAAAGAPPASQNYDASYGAGGLGRAVQIDPYETQFKTAWSKALETKV